MRHTLGTARRRGFRRTMLPALLASLGGLAAATAQAAGEPPAAQAPFTGFRLDQLPAQAQQADARWPWGRAPGAEGMADAQRSGAYHASLMQVMAKVQALKGRDASVTVKNYEAIWAPFFQFPTRQGLAYFEQLAPALDDYLSAAGEVETLAPAWRDGVADLAVAAAAGNDRATHAALQAANAQGEALERSRQKLLAATQRARQLGEAPNPLAALAAARLRYRSAVATPAAPAVAAPPPAAADRSKCTTPYGDCEIKSIQHVNVGGGPKALLPTAMSECCRAEMSARAGYERCLQQQAVGCRPPVPDPACHCSDGGAPSTTPALPPVGTMPATDSAAAAAPAASDAAVRAEAAAHHLALAQQREDSARRWDTEAQREKDPVRQRELQDRAEFDRDMAQAERDLAATVQTGVMQHTRTEWQNRQQNRLIQNIRSELDDFDKDHRRVQAIPKLAAMVAGPEGLRLQGEIHQRMREALAAPDRGARLEQLQAQLKRLVAAQRDAELGQHAARVAEADARLATAEGLKAGADSAFWAATWLVPGGGTVSLAYGVGTGYVEGGIQQALETSARSYSQVVDIGFAAIREGLVQDEEGRRKGVGAAVWAGLSTAITNKLTGYTAGKTTGLVQGAINRARGPATNEPRPEHFKDNQERYQEALQQARTPAQQQQVRSRFAVIATREALRGELAAATRRHEQSIPPAARNADGSVNTRHPAYQHARQAWERDLAAVRTRYAPAENRMAVHAQALKAAGLGGKDVELSGGEPKSVMSDIDVAPARLADARKYAGALKASGHEVMELPDRWVVPGIDMTIWKSSRGSNAPESASYQEAVIQAALRGSDKFPTRGGVEHTTQEGVTFDAKGAVISNFKKAHESGFNAIGSPDLHVVGKSLDKAAEIAGHPIDARLLAQARAKRQHLTDEEAGIATFGLSPEAKAREQARFLAQSKAAFADVIQAAGERSDRAAAVLKKQLAEAEGRRDSATANEIRATLAAYRISNDLTLQTIANRDPQGVAELLGREAQPAPSVRGFGWLNEALARDRELLARHTAQAEPPLPLPGVGERCRQAAAALNTRLAGARNGSAEAATLAALKAALERGAADPGRAVTEVRLLAGHELAEVLRDLAPAR